MSAIASSPGTDAAPAARSGDLDEIMREQPKLADAVKNLLSYMAAESVTQNSNSPAKTQKFLGTARKILAAFNRASLPTVVEWGAAHPQGEAEEGMQRIETLAMYRRCVDLKEIVSNRGGKVSSVLGRTYARVVFPELSVEIDDTEEARDFLTKFRESLEDDEDDGFGRLIWSANLQQELQRRAQQRKEAAKNRVQTLGSPDSVKIKVVEGDDDDS